MISTLAIDFHDVRLAAFSPDGERIAVAGDSQSVSVWTTKSGVKLGATRAAAAVRAIAFSQSHDSLTVVTGSEVLVWPFASDGKATEIRLSAGFVSIDVSPDRAVAVTADGAGELRLWQLDSGESSLIGRHPGVTAVAFAHSVSGIASGGDRSIRLWSLLDRAKEPVTFGSYDEVPLSSLLFTRDNAHLIAASARGVIRVWPVKGGLSGRDGVNRLAPLLEPVLSENGRFVITGRPTTLRVTDRDFEISLNLLDRQQRKAG